MIKEAQSEKKKVVPWQPREKKGKKQAMILRNESGGR